MTRSVAVIPARGGSKRLPRKNILPFRGRPMILWTVEAAKKAGCFDRIIVTTDDPEYAATVEGEGVDVLMRPAELGADNVTLVPVAEHALETTGETEGTFCLLMPNCPLRTAEDVLNVRQKLLESEADSAMSISSYGWLHPEWALYEEGEQLKAVPWKDDSVDFVKTKGPLYTPTGAVRWCRTEAFLEQKTFYPDNLSGCFIPWHRAVDIDTQEDYAWAQCIAHALDHGFAFGGEE